MYLNIKKDVQWKMNKSDSDFLKLVHNEHKEVGTLKEEKILATSENSHNKIQDHIPGICKGMREFKFNDILQQKRRQQLRANSQELRQLERQLQSALVTKQLKEQKQLLAEQKKEDFRKKLEENSKFAADCKLVHKSILLQKEQEKQKKEALRGMLKTQMSELQQKRRTEFENIVKDRDEMEKVLKLVQAKENTKRREAELLRERYKQEMEESYCDREFKRQLEKSRNDDDAKRDLAYQKECDNLKVQMAAEKNRIQKEKEAISERIGQQLATFNREKEKRENLLLSLLVEERKAKEEELYRKVLVKQIKEREQLRIDLDKYRHELRIRNEIQLKEEENKFREDNMRYLAERDKLDQLSNEKQRRKKLEHSKALKEMIDTRRRQKADAIAKRISDFENIKNIEKER